VRTKIVLMLLAFGPLCSQARAQERPTPVSPLNVASSQIYITHVTVIDTETGKEAKDRTVIISGERISEVRDGKDVRPPADAKVVDGKGKFLIPGLWDMHVHPVRVERLDNMFPMLVANGVLGVRDMGTDMRVADIDPLRKQIADGSLLGPRIVATGQILDGRPKPASATFVAVKTPVEGREAVRSLKAGGADFIKVYSWLPRDAYFAIVEEAKRQNIPFVGHVPMSVTVLEASDAGQKSIEHLTGVDLACSSREHEIRGELLRRGTEMTNDTRWSLEAVEAIASYSEEKATKVFAHLAQNHTWQVPTFVAFLQDAQFNDSRVTVDARLKYIPPTIQKRWNEYARQHAGPSPWDKVFEKRLSMVSVMHRAGIPMLAGTDAAWGVPYIYAGFSLHDELALFVRAGLTPLESLQTATLNPARFLGRTQDLGTIEKGKLADMVMLTANPLEDIHNTQKIDAVFVNGRLLTRRDLDALLAQAETAVTNK
jgi:imidazolonepropionase-like amidohydrolase